MKLKNGFITHESKGNHVTVTTGSTSFNGLINSNTTAGFIVECLKDDVTTEEIIEKMFERYDAPKEVITEDVEKILDILRGIGAIDD